MPSGIYELLTAARGRSATARTLYSQDGTLSRRGLVERADRRARELAGAGVGAGSTVILSMGNVPEFIVLLAACSRLGAVAMPVDPTGTERDLLEAAARRPIAAVVRRPRGVDAKPPAYPRHEIRSRKRLAGSLLSLDALEPAADHPGAPLPAGTELLYEVRGIVGVQRDVAVARDDLERRIRAAVAALELRDEAPRILCREPLTVPVFFDAVVLAWLGSPAQLVLSETASLETAVGAAGGTGQLITVDTCRSLLQLARACAAAGRRIEAVPVTIDVLPGRTGERLLRERLGSGPRRLFFLDELGLLATEEGAGGLRPLPGAALRGGASMEVGGHEILVQTPTHHVVLPPPGEDEPGTPADDEGWLHTGWAGRFGRDGGLQEVLGRDDGLVWLDGRRTCLESLEEAVRAHRRVTFARATLRRDADDTPVLAVEYRATGTTEVEDLEEHLLATLPPFMVPRQIDRIAG